ncbi:hypothetical protein HWI79_15 [Cryptosporidium felis]|nr:hypothetical protein HWI79_15 [Cryptosporidium felis]
MKEIEDESRTWSGTREIKNFETSPEIQKKRGETVNGEKRYSGTVRKCLPYLLIATIGVLSLILLFLILDKSNQNPVLVYFQGVFPSKSREDESYKPGFRTEIAAGNSFLEKSSKSRSYPSSEITKVADLTSSSGRYQSVLDFYINRFFLTPLSKMSLTIPVNKKVLRSYQVEAIDYTTDDEMVLYLSLGHQFKINNETMILYDGSMKVLNHFQTNQEENPEDIPKDSQEREGLKFNSEKRLRSEENRKLQQHEYYNYTSTSEWNHKPQVVNNIIPTYYPRNPYVPPYGNPYYFAPNILVPYVYIY